MIRKNFDKIMISFERPKDSTDTVYEFMQNPPKIEGGALYDQVVMVQEETSLQELIETFTQVSETLSDAIGETASYVIASVFSLVWNSTSIDLFPDDYKEILDLIETTDRGNILNIEKLDQLIEIDEEVLEILEELRKQGFLKKNSDDKYVVRKKVLANVEVSFLQIAK